VFDFRTGLVHVPGEPSGHLRTVLGGLQPPAERDWAAVAEARTGVAIYDGDPLDNDQVGNCVACGALRSIQARRAIAGGDTRRPTGAMARALYRVWGWDGTPANDLGLRSDVAAAAWSSRGVEWGDVWLDIPFVSAIDPANEAHVRAALAFLGPLQLDLALREGWQDADIWDVSDAPLWGDHRVCAMGYDPDGVDLVTWGLRRRLTWAALARFGLAIYATVSASWLDNRWISPPGLDLAALQAEAAALAA